MDQDTTTRPGNEPLALGDPTPHCGAIDDHGDDTGIVICTAAAGHAGDHAAYDSDGESCGTWPQDSGAQPAGEDTRRRDSIAALRAIAEGYAQLADAIEARPAIPAPDPVRAYVLLCVQTAEELAAAARALPCTLAKDADEQWFNLNGQLGGLDVQLFAAREKVCTITGYEDREVEEVVTPAVTEKVTKPMPVWECAPILAGRTAGGAA